jgi:hypothetical protein
LFSVFADLSYSWTKVTLLFNRMMVNPEAQREEADHKTLLFFLLLLISDVFCASKGPRMYTMSPPLQGSNLVEGSRPQPEEDEEQVRPAAAATGDVDFRSHRSPSVYA